MRQMVDNGIAERRLLLSIPHTTLLLHVVQNGPVTYANLVVASGCCKTECVNDGNSVVCYRCKRPALLLGTPVPTDNFLAVTQVYNGPITSVLIKEQFDVFTEFYLQMNRDESLILAGNLQTAVSGYLKSVGL